MTTPVTAGRGVRVDFADADAAKRYLEGRMRQRFDGYKGQSWSVTDAHAVRRLLTYIRVLEEAA